MWYDAYLKLSLATLSVLPGVSLVNGASSHSRLGSWQISVILVKRVGTVYVGGNPVILPFITKFTDSHVDTLHQLQRLSREVSLLDPPFKCLCELHACLICILQWADWIWFWTHLWRNIGFVSRILRGLGRQWSHFWSIWCQFCGLYKCSILKHSFSILLTHYVPFLSSEWSNHHPFWRWDRNLCDK